MEIPAAAIHRLQSSIREAASVPPPSSSPSPAPPFPSFADAIAAFDPDASPELLCGRCGAAGGLLRGAQSAVCAYCGSPRREEDEGIAFLGSAAYRWLLGSLRLDGSEPVEFDGDSTDSNKSNEAPKSGVVLSDLLDIRLTFPPENKEISGSSISNKQPSVACTFNLPGVNLDSFFVERKEETAAAAALLGTHSVVQEKHSTSQMKATTAFANWDADFQPAGSESVVADPKQPDLFKSKSVADSSLFPASGSAISPVLAAGNETYMRSTGLERSEDLASASGTINKDNLFIQKAAPATVESNSAMVDENSVTEFTGSSLDKISVQSSQLFGRGDTGVSNEEAFDEWQEFTGGGNQGTLTNVGEHTEGDSSQIKGTDSFAVRSMESANNAAGDSDDWQAFASTSAQGGDVMKLVEGSSSDETGLGNQVAETSISPEHPLEANSVDLWPVGNVKEHTTTEIVKQTDDSFDDWQDFTTSGQAEVTSFNLAGQLTDVSHFSHREIDMDTWFTDNNTRESGNADLVNGNKIMLDDWQGFAGSDQTQQSSYNVGGELTGISFERHEGTGPVQLWANASNNEATNTVSTNIEDDSFDIWQDVTTSRHQQEKLSSLAREVSGVSSEPAQEIDSMDLWLTSNVKESNSSRKGVGRIDDATDGWQDFASFGQPQGNIKNPVKGQFLKDLSGTEPVDLWSSSHTEQFKNLEPINQNNDPFDGWQDFKNSPQLETNSQDLPGDPLSDKPSVSVLDILGLESGSYAQSATSQSKMDKRDKSNEANVVPSGEHFERRNVMQQMGDDDALSAIWATSHGSSSTPKSEAGNANVERLLSQMHDLSFMLKDELSVPDKAVDS
uniref:Uncharacterized protein n=1 Tax=Avena sativa TaxID=4498 RepID=A0ACD6AMD9_AVESA